VLKFESAWRFSSPGEIPDTVFRELSKIIAQIARNEQRVIECFKGHFASAAGCVSSWSSSVSWAETDLHSYMTQASTNAPLFIEAFYEACEELKSDDKDQPIPDLTVINRILGEHTDYQISPPNLIVNNAKYVVPAPAQATQSFDEEAQNLIQESLSDSRRLLSEGRYRPAIQEILWLLETVVTAFRGESNGNGTSIQGKYFNKIIGDLRRSWQGTTLDQVLEWVTKLHGYLSSPTGGGIRHGRDLKDGVATTSDEAFLYFNLISSYVAFLLSEHERQKKKEEDDIPF